VAGENPIRVVLVDDHRLFADALTLLLERDGRVAIVGTAPNAEDGIDLALEHDAQVVVMDVSMPGIDGLEATRRLRELKPEVAVIILSGTADFADAARAAGAAGYLTKGRVHDEVVDAIVSAAGHHADDLPGRDGLPG
jgi:DNA-binding NarL/FixJ family response regulator